MFTNVPPRSQQPVSQLRSSKRILRLVNNAYQRVYGAWKGGTYHRLTFGSAQQSQALLCNVW